MTRLVSLVAFSILFLLLVGIWTFKMVVDNARSVFPSELPERPQKAYKPSLSKRLTGKLSSSMMKRKELPDLTCDGYPPHAPAAQVTSHHVLTRPSSNLLNTAQPASAATAQDYKATSRFFHSIFSQKRTEMASLANDGQLANNTSRLVIRQTTPPIQPTIRRKPLASEAAGTIKDPILERFERLKLSHGGKPQSHLSAPSVSLLSPQNASTLAPSWPHSTKDFLQAAKLTLANKAGASRPLRPRDGQTSSNRGQDESSPDSPAVPNAPANVPQPTIASKSNDASVHTRAQKRIENPFQRHTQVPRKRALLPPRHRAIASPRILRRRSRSPSLSDRSSGGTLTPDSSEEASYSGLFRRDQYSEVLHQRPSTASSTSRFLDSEDAAQLQERLDRKYALELQQQEENQFQNSLFAQLNAAAHRPEEQRFRRSLGRPVPAGTQDDPIDLDSDSDSDDSDRVVFTGRQGGVDRTADHDDPMDIDEGPSQEDLDAELAQFLQEEYEDRVRQAGAGTRECVVCGDSCATSGLPSLADCEHPPRTCSECFSGWLTAQLQDSGWRKAKCPDSECTVKLTYHEIQHLATPQIFGQYDSFIARAAISEDRMFYIPYTFTTISPSGLVYLSSPSHR